MSMHRVLLVEDFCTFRRAIRMLLEQHPDFQVVGEAANGYEAIQQAARLLPDLILLDINLPQLNGLQVVPQILNLSSSSKIVFLTQEASADIAEEALGLGARGYLVKADAGSELLESLEAIARGERYLSRRLSAQIPGEVLRGLGIKSRSVKQVAPPGPIASQKEHTQCAHEAQYCLDDSDFQESLRVCVSKALSSGDAVIVLATEFHQDALCRGLQAKGQAVKEAIRTGRLQLVDAEAAIAEYLTDEPRDEKRSIEEARLLVESAEKARIGEYSRVCVFGECLSLLYAKGKGEVVLRLERLWSELGKTHNLYLRCWYVVSRQQLEYDSQFFQRVCKEHTTVHSL